MVDESRGKLVVHVRKEVIDRLDRIAERRDCPRSALIREAVARYIEEKERASLRKGS